MALLETRRRPRPATLLGTCIGLLLGAGCDYFTFDVSESEAAVRVLEPPADFGSGAFGAVLTGWSFPGDEGLEGRFAVSGGGGTPLAVFPSWRAGELGELERPLYEGCQEDVGVQCGGRPGVALLGFPQWVDGTGQPRRGCVLTTSPQDGLHVVICDDTWGVYRPLRTDPGIGFSAAPLPAEAAETLGVGLLGAPELGSAGLVVRLSYRAIEPPRGLWARDEPPLGQPGARLGAAIATWPEGPGSVLVAVGAPGAERVLVGRLATGADMQVHFEVLACLGPEESAPGFGGEVALGDFDGDGVPELVASADEEAEERLQRLWRWKLEAARLTGAGCEPGGPPGPAPDQVVSCDALVPEGASVDWSCEAARFASTLAAGDLDGDGDQELLVGAPGAIVRQSTEAGMVVVLDGGAEGLRVEGARLLYDASPEQGARLGAALALAPTAPGEMRRDEVVAGAPGTRRAYLFLCSGLPGDSPSREDGTDRCLQP